MKERKRVPFYETPCTMSTDAVGQRLLKSTPTCLSYR